jgi:hypothetical protein
MKSRMTAAVKRPGMVFSAPKARSPSVVSRKCLRALSPGGSVGEPAQREAEPYLRKHQSRDPGERGSEVLQTLRICS